MKTKTKIKVLVAVILLVVTIITIALIGLSLNTVSYGIAFNAPDRIAIYYNKQSTNKVFERGTDEHEQIYSLVLDSFEQPILKAITSGTLNKKVKINENEPSSINYKGIVVHFMYDTPQVAKYKTKTYTNNGVNYWYEGLKFNISGNNKMQYNIIAIIPPENSVDYVSSNDYVLHYSIFSNFNSLYNNALEIFN